MILGLLVKDTSAGGGVDLHATRDDANSATVIIFLSIFLSLYYGEPAKTSVFIIF